MVQKIRGNTRRYPNGWGEVAPLTGLLYCADCGSKMYVHRINNGKRVSQYTCANYSKMPIGTLCTSAHRVNEAAILQLISELLTEISKTVKQDREAMAQMLQDVYNGQKAAEIRRTKSNLEKAKIRAEDIARGVFMPVSTISVAEEMSAVNA